MTAKRLAGEPCMDGIADPGTLDILRGAFRAAWLGLLLLGCCAHFLLTRPRGLRARVAWRQRWSRIVLDALGISLRVYGTVPASGVLAGNHLSYLDILTYGAVTPAVFVGKQELRSWPVLGFITRSGGTIYVDRKSPRSAAAANRAMDQALAEGLPVVLFPEGTSSAGEQVLPVQSPLFQAPVQRNEPIWTAAIAYSIDGSLRGTGQHVCYWGGMTFGPHILRLLQLGRVSADLHIASEPIHATDRRTAAALCQRSMDELLIRAKQSTVSTGRIAAAVEQTAVA